MTHLKSGSDEPLPHAGSGSRTFDRRAFVTTLLCGGIALSTSGFSRGDGSRRVRIGRIIRSAGPTSTGGLERGIELGVEEAARAGELLGVRVELLRAPDMDDSSPVEAGRTLLGEGAEALLIDSGSAAALASLAEGEGVPLLVLDPDSSAFAASRSGGNIFSVAPDPGIVHRAAVAILHSELGFERWVVMGEAPESAFAQAQHAIEEAGGRVVATLAGVDPEGPGAIAALARRSGAQAFLVLGRPSRAWISAYAALDPGIPLVVSDPGVLPPTDPSWPGNVRSFWPALWHDSLFRFGASQLNGRFFERFGSGMDASGWLGWLAVKIVWEASLRSARSGEGLLEYLRGGSARFDGHKGRSLTFRDDGLLRQPIYLFGVGGDAGGESEGGSGIVVVGEAPAPSEAESFEEAFDRLAARPEGVAAPESLPIGVPTWPRRSAALP